MLLLDTQQRLGEAMKREWQVHRTFAEDTDGQRRWDAVYQLLLRWMMEHQPVELSSQENDREDRPLCSSINQSANTDSKH
jgi:hypothetical protein